MIHVRARGSDGRVYIDLPIDSLHAMADDEHALVWLDLEAPTPDEIGLAGTIFGWVHLTVEDLVRQGQRAKLESFPGYSYLVMHALSYDAAGGRLATPELDFVIGRNYIASVHAQPLAQITQSREAQQRTEQMLGAGPDYLLYTLTDLLVDSYFPVMDQLDDALDGLQDQIVTKPTNAEMSRIFDMKRDAVLLRKVISPQLEIFSRLTSPDTGIVRPETAVYFRDVHDHVIRIFEVADGYRDLLAGALDAYLSTVSNLMNDVMKRLTVLTALFLPITAVSGLLGMNLRRSPPWTDSLFWVLVGVLLGLSAAQFVYMRRRGWT
ncbi:MAG TPA: magnesium transporter CorA family protein [Dehalococcoidia bacterium]|nr:magnesium transporter CorA family protein [Dehalococcoidia bacterium]